MYENSCVSKTLKNILLFLWLVHSLSTCSLLWGFHRTGAGAIVCLPHLLPLPLTWPRALLCCVLDNTWLPPSSALIYFSGVSILILISSLGFSLLIDTLFISKIFSQFFFISLISSFWGYYSYSYFPNFLLWIIPNIRIKYILPHKFNSCSWFAVFTFSIHVI